MIPPSKQQQAVIKAAVEWWHSRRPLNWGEPGRCP